jgi:hypothetical protein
MAKLDPAVKVLNVADTHSFPAFGAPERRTVYTYMVGKLGPFTRVFGAAENDEGSVSHVINEHVRSLRSMGALPEGT